MEEVVVQRLIAASEAQGDDPGWSIKVLTAGIQITYTWPIFGSFYTVENLTPWASIARAPLNPLLLAMNDLIKQKTEFKP